MVSDFKAVRLRKFNGRLEYGDDGLYRRVAVWDGIRNDMQSG